MDNTMLILCEALPNGSPVEDLRHSNGSSNLGDSDEHHDGSHRKQSTNHFPAATKNISKMALHCHANLIRFVHLSVTGHLTATLNDCCEVVTHPEQHPLVRRGGQLLVNSMRSPWFTVAKALLYPNPAY
ncbi:hypothetical protein V5799_032651 [Amblyomma americanum]|uniref:Uncharacterized protein n=1 Tax=Amblyomma americanum TaxID=6943 RepID=A0AAQ4DQK0_AMBAM